MRLIDADKLKRKVQRIATEAWKMRLTANIETTLNQFIDYLNEAPTIEIPQWIPCSEKLPSENDEYIITMGKDSFNKEGYVTWAMFDKLKKKFYFPGGRVNYYIAVTAWMPLPKPWKGADDE